MLEVGVVGENGHSEGGLSPAEEKTHFLLWCVVSSPLTLSFDLGDDEVLDRVWPLISAVEAIQVNQQWAGHPGTLIKQDDGADVCSGLDDAKASVDLGGAPPAPCARNSSRQQFMGDWQCMGLRFGGNTSAECCTACAVAGSECDTYQFCGKGKPCAGVHGVPVSGACYIGKASDCIKTNNGWASWWAGDGPAPAPAPPPPGGCWQGWSKPQPNGSVAVLLINTGSVTRNIPLNFSDYMYVGFGGAESKPSATEVSTGAAVVDVRDIFARRDLGQHQGSMVFEVASHDSVFVLLTRGRVDASTEAP